MKTNMNMFFGSTSAAEIQLRYDELSKIFNSQDDLLQAIKAEYNSLLSVLNVSKPVEPAKEKTFTVADIIKLVQERFNPKGLKLEQTGTWIWLSGAGTFALKEGLKQLGFRYSVNKQSFYWRSDVDKCTSAIEKPVPIELIRKKYGSNVVAL